MFWACACHLPKTVKIRASGKANMPAREKRSPHRKHKSPRSAVFHLCGREKHLSTILPDHRLTPPSGLTRLLTIMRPPSSSHAQATATARRNLPRHQLPDLITRRLNRRLQNLARMTLTKPDRSLPSQSEKLCPG